MSVRWIEVWAEVGTDPPYLLLVCGSSGSPPRIAVLDPSEAYKEVFAAPDYDSVRFYLLEDEFTQVRGRLNVPKEDG